MTKEKEYECLDCGAIFEIMHEETDEVSFCPFCSNSLEELELDEDFYDDSEELE